MTFYDWPFQIHSHPRGSGPTLGWGTSTLFNVISYCSLLNPIPFKLMDAVLICFSPFRVLNHFRGNHTTIAHGNSEDREKTISTHIATIKILNRPASAILFIYLFTILLSILAPSIALGLYIKLRITLYIFLYPLYSSLLSFFFIILRFPNFPLVHILNFIINKIIYLN
jgi:hypothetical protein